VAVRVDAVFRRCGRIPTALQGRIADEIDRRQQLDVRMRSHTGVDLRDRDACALVGALGHLHGRFVRGLPAMSMLAATGSSEATKSTMECSASRATTLAGRLTDIHRDEGSHLLAHASPEALHEHLLRCAPGARRKRTMTFIFAEPLRLEDRRALSLSLPGFHRVALPALAETETRPSTSPRQGGATGGYIESSLAFLLSGCVHSNADAMGCPKNGDAN
jgi:hypothetical protein